MPKDLIAQYPEEDRSASRLLILDRATGRREHRFFRDLPSYFGPGDVLVVNETKVVPARLAARKRSGGKLDILLTERIDERHWYCLVQNAGRQRALDAVINGVTVSLQKNGHAWIAEFSERGDDIIRDYGSMPLPHYIKRAGNGIDAERYQTIYAREPGSIAAPTAGLHFTEELLEAIRRRGVCIAKLILHIGVGTFRLIRKENVEEHQMDAEYYVIPEDARALLRQARAEGRRLVAVGTSTVRALESSFSSDKEGLAEGPTRLFIYPGYHFHMVDGLITNFHLPRSTPLLLAAAFAGRESLLACYKEAIEQKYRFYSYGDAMLLL